MRILSIDSTYTLGATGPAFMTFEIALTLGILGLAIVLFVTEIIRADLVALMVLVTLVIVGLVKPEESIAGFANPAVVTIWAVFILSAGLARTGVASMLGAQVLRLSGPGERRLIAVLMSSTAVLSGFMNNIGVAAMFLPVTMDIAQRTGRAASRLLLPMAYGSLLGGMLVLIGTASNLVVSDFLRTAGMRPLGLFEFTPIGLVILVVSVLYMLLVGRRLLPLRQTPQPLSAAEGEPRKGGRDLYGLEERLAVLLVPEGSPLVGKTLAESRIGRALGLNILSIKRPGGIRYTAEPNRTLDAGDRLLALGRLDIIDELASRPAFIVEDRAVSLSRLLSEETGLAELDVTPGSLFDGRTIVDVEVRRTMGVNVLAVRRGDVVYRTNLHGISLQQGDRLIVQGPDNRLERLLGQPGYRRLGVDEIQSYQLDERLICMHIPRGSPLAGRTIEEARLADKYGISALTITREGQDRFVPEPSTPLQEDDLLLVGGRPTDLDVLRGLQTLIVQRDIRLNIKELEHGPLDMVEVMLSPYTTLAGKTLRDLRFRERFGVSVLAIWRGDRAYRTGLGDIPLAYGDAFLCYGPREKFEILARDSEFVVLKLDVQEKPLVEKAPLAGVIMAGVVAAVLLNWLPIYVAAIAGASLMVLTRCLTMEEAYRSIEWQGVFLIAAMLPLGLAMQRTGAAELLAQTVVQVAGPHGPTAILAGIVLLTLVINQFIPSAVNAVVMTPIALATSGELGISPYPFVMGIAYAVASSFMTPVSHPANVLVMSPGGYRFSDYMKNGLPITVIVFVVTVLLLPVVFPY
jgi:di/tricarboxylate transporter